MGFLPNVCRLAASCALLLVLSTSCQLMVPAETDEEVKAKKLRAKSQAPRIPKDVLANFGLKEVRFVSTQGRSTREAKDAGVQSVYLLDEGIVVVTRPEKEGGERLVKLLDKESLNAIWWETVSGPITEVPYSYTYPPGVKKAPEFIFRVHDTIHCLHLQYGGRLWSKSVEPPISSRVIANETHVFFGSGTGRVYGYRKGADFDDWQYRTNGPVEAAPLFSGSKVVFASHDGGVYGLVPDAGWRTFQSWKFQTGARVVAGMTPFSRWLFVGSTDYKLRCLEASDGSLYWDFGAEAPIQDAPVVLRYRPNNEYVYCIANDGSRSKPRRTLFAVPLPKGQVAPTGKAAWRQQGVRRVITIGQNTLYVLNELGPGREASISGLDVQTGKEQFRVSVTGFHFVPPNYADAGRDKKARGRIYLIGRDGTIQIIAETKA